MDDTIKVSTRYNDFSLLGSNRETVRGHIENLKTAFEEVGNLTQVQPILVNDRMQIIDGQHRFIAAKELGLPIYYSQVSGLGIAEARSINLLHRSWKVEDYARSYSETGDRNYQNYLKLREDYGVSHSQFLLASVGDDNKQGVFKRFRDGDYSFDAEATKARLDEVAKAFDAIGEIAVNRKAFTSALLKATENPQFNLDKMVRKLEAYQTRVRNLATISDNLRMLEEIYNYNVREANLIRLY